MLPDVPRAPYSQRADMGERVAGEVAAGSRDAVGPPRGSRRPPTGPRARSCPAPSSHSSFGSALPAESTFRVAASSSARISSRTSTPLRWPARSTHGLSAPWPRRSSSTPCRSDHACDRRLSRRPRSGETSRRSRPPSQSCAPVTASLVFPEGTRRSKGFRKTRVARPHTPGQAHRTGVPAFHSWAGGDPWDGCSPASATPGRRIRRADRAR